MKKTENSGNTLVPVKVIEVSTYGNLKASRFYGLYVDDSDLGSEMFDALGIEDGTKIGYGKITVTIEAIDPNGEVL